MTKADRYLMESITEALSVTDRVCSSINVGSTKTGINMDAVKMLGEIILETSRNHLCGWNLPNALNLSCLSFVGYHPTELDPRFYGKQW